jgi:two-component system chemotaxis response regulator CheY
MRVLIVEDDFSGRKILQHILSPFGSCDIAVDGEEAIEAFNMAWGEKNPYDLICMDIMMPNMDGQEALRRIRGIENEMGINGSEEVKIIMTTALGDPKNVFQAFKNGGATSYIVKPINKQKFLEELQKIGLIS